MKYFGELDIIFFQLYDLLDTKIGKEKRIRVHKNHFSRL